MKIIKETDSWNRIILDSGELGPLIDSRVEEVLEFEKSYMPSTSRLVLPDILKEARVRIKIRESVVSEGRDYVLGVDIGEVNLSAFPRPPYYLDSQEYYINCIKSYIPIESGGVTEFYELLPGESITIGQGTMHNSGNYSIRVTVKDSYISPRTKVSIIPKRGGSSMEISGTTFLGPGKTLILNLYCYQGSPSKLLDSTIILNNDGAVHWTHSVISSIIIFSGDWIIQVLPDLKRKVAEITKSGNLNKISGW